MPGYLLASLRLCLDSKVAECNLHWHRTDADVRFALIQKSQSAIITVKARLRAMLCLDSKVRRVQSA